jgi:glycosylphosphatidylinositol transamidase
MLPIFLAQALAKLPIQQVQITQSFSLLLLGATLSTLSTLNFSLALIAAALCSPLNFVRPLPSLPSRLSVGNNAEGSEYLNKLAVICPATALYFAISPPVVLYAVSAWVGKGLEWMLVEVAMGWVAQGVWTSLVVWGVWWPTWVVGGGVLLSGIWRAA